MSNWWLNHATPHMNALLAQDGPFAGATDENDVGAPLPYRRPPDGTFAPDFRFGDDPTAPLIREQRPARAR